MYDYGGSSASPSDAQVACSGTGGNLASFISQDDIDNMKNVMPDPYWYYWTGLRYTKSSDSWSFIDGTNTVFALSKLPTLTTHSYHSDKCVKMRGNGALYPTHCTEVRHYICQIGQHPVPTDPPSSSG